MGVAAEAPPATPLDVILVEASEGSRHFIRWDNYIERHGKPALANTFLEPRQPVGTDTFSVAIGEALQFHDARRQCVDHGVCDCRAVFGDAVVARANHRYTLRTKKA